MKKLILYITLFLFTTLIHAQNENEFNLSPNGLLEKVFDHYGNSYKISDVLIGKEVRGKNNELLRATNPTPMICGYYNLYFETGSGMEDSSNPTHIARRNVVCQVFSDLSNFINTPLTTNGLNNRVNIWVRNIANIPGVPSNVIGLASSFYSMPYNTTAGFGGIVDNEIWKTIHLGKDSYTNVVSPLVSNGISSGTSGVFYHGMMAFNFSDSSVNWNTNLTTSSFPNLYDLYSVVLHEITHALGFASLINSSGTSKFNAGYNYFTRYDTKLKNNTDTQFLIKKNTNACGTMYNYSFNSVLNSSILYPTSYSCANDIRYVGLSNVPVFTPSTFSNGSSLSHFDEVCVSPNPNFVMNSSTGLNVIKRYLKPEERNTLGDLGYSVNTTYGVSSTYQGIITYTGTISGIAVAGMNDGINTDGNFTYIGVATTANPIVINSSTNSQIRILSNDTSSSTHFECLEDITDPNANFSNTAGSGIITEITFSTTISGLHLLRYVPTNSTGNQKGNITYIYVYVTSNANCAIPTVCNLVMNGDFEQSSSIPNNFGQINNACGWINSSQGSPDYLHADTENFNIDVPCNKYGKQLDKITLNKGYVAFYDNASVTTTNTFSSENFVTKLTNPLQPNTEYQLSFDLSLAEGVSRFRMKAQAYLSTALSISSSYYLTISNPQMLFINPTFSNISDGWERITFKIPARPIAGEEYLYLGALIYPSISPLSALNNEINCNYTISNNTGQSFTSTGYYLDNVELIPLNGADLNLPEELCENEALTNLTSYVVAAPSNGVFYGPGVTVSGGVYSFSASLAGLGTHSIVYSYANGSGCTISISKDIIVQACTDPCPEDLIFTTTETSASATYQASGTIVTNTNYLINSGAIITLKAGNSITFSPISEIKAGSDFTAKIENCNQSRPASGETVTNKGEELLDRKELNDYELSIFPNPTKNTVMISAGVEINSLMVVSMDGKTIFDKKIKNVNSYQLDLSNYQNGIYVLIVETINGNLIREKIIKN